jgi:predicted SAM-dependent methyltransferase
MKDFLRRLVRTIAGWPFVGRITRIGIAVVRGPNTLDGHHALIASHKRLEVLMGEMGRREQAFFSDQLPQLLQTVSDINSRQNRGDADQANLVKSVPVALRTITQELRQLPLRFASISDLQARTSQFVEAKDVRPLSDSIGYLLGRVEFVRRELMFEMRYGASASHADNEKLSIEAKVISKEKLVLAQETGVRLNLGCGHIPLDDYLNVDLRALPGVDIVAEIDNLPFGAGEVQEIHSAHMLEHFPQEQLRRSLLPYFYDLLKPGGKLRSVVPDAEAMIREYSQGNYPYDDLREVIYGGQDYDGDFHFNMFTPKALGMLLAEAGFKSIEVLAEGRRNGKCYEFEIVAEKEPAAL